MPQRDGARQRPVSLAETAKFGAMLLAAVTPAQTVGSMVLVALLGSRIEGGSRRCREDRINDRNHTVHSHPVLLAHVPHRLPQRLPLPPPSRGSSSRHFLTRRRAIGHRTQA